MARSCEEATQSSLASTLLLALTQTQALTRELDAKAQTVDRLLHENNRLRQELETLRTKEHGKDQQRPLDGQVQHLFALDAEKQVEIDRLKAKLRNARTKERKRRFEHPSTSSPLISSDGLSTPVQSPRRKSLALSKSLNEENNASRNNKEDTLLDQENAHTHPHKRLRSHAPASNHTSGEVCREEVLVSPIQQGRARLEARSSDTSGAEAIPFIAEDGENYDQMKHKTTPKGSSLAKQSESARHRLNALLSAPSAPNPLLPRPSVSSTRPETRMSSIYAKSKLFKPNPAVSFLSNTTSENSARPSFLPPKSRPVTGSEGQDPIRARRLDQLNLAHFKPNPKINDGYDYAFNDVVRGREQRRCLSGCTRKECCGGKFEALAATLGSLASGMTEVSENQLLMDFLGPGSEDRIKSMTKIARSNLLHEARAKRIADLYGKMHRHAHERGKSPPGFWEADMPGTQENVRIREEAEKREREEVRKRYSEACKPEGRWIFADE